MDKICFVNKWGKNRKTSWSGTSNGIFLSLQKYYDVADCPIEYSFTENIITKGFLFFRRYFGFHNFFHILNSKFSEKHLKRMTDIESSKAVIVFGELYSQYISKTYIYQDLTINFLADMYKSKSELIRYTPLSPSTPIKYVNKRLEMVNRFYADCKGLLTMSQWLCEYMKGLGIIDSSKVHYVGGGCNIDSIRIDPSHKQQNKFLFVGKDFERKNGPLVVEAFNLLHKKYPNTQLYIAGPQNLTGKLGRGIEFLGRLTYDELVEYYNKCDFFVMPSRFEAYGIVFAEALTFGLPCIGKNCFAMPEFIQDGENGYLIENDDPNELAEKMERLLNNSTMVKNVINSKDDYIKKYSWDAVAQRIQNVIEADFQKN